MNNVLISKVTERGQVTLPQSIRRSPAFAGARAVQFTEQNGVVLIQPLTQSADREHAQLLDATMRDWSDPIHDSLFDFS
ncbi:hypothetical protein EBR66_01990 [bacterium]|nr:hypothetical protein [bacterium]